MSYPVDKYLFKVNNNDTRSAAFDDVLVSFLITFNRSVELVFALLDQLDHKLCNENN